VHSLKTVLHCPRLVASAVIALGGIATYAINFPGSMEDDSFVQLLEGRTASYSNWHPPVMSWLLGISDSLIGPASAWFVLFQMVVAFGALAAVLWLPKRVSRSAVVAAAGMLVLPQLFMLQAVVWKDALFADAVLAGFICLAYAGKCWNRRYLRAALITLSAVFLTLAVLTRQNGIVVLPCAVLALALIAAKFDGCWRRAWVPSGALLLITVVFAFSANALLQLRGDGYPAQQEQFKVLELYDITGMVNRDLDLPLSVLDREAPQLAHVIRGEGVARWSPIMNDTLETSPRIVAALDATPAPVLARQWHQLIRDYPGEYLTVRAILFRWVFQPPDVGLCHPFHVGDQGNGSDLKELGIQPRMDRRDLMLWHYADFFQFNTPVFSHALWALVGLGLLYPLLRRRDSADLAVAALIATSFVFTATFLVISIACDYRYLYLIDLSALAGILYVAADWRELKHFVPRVAALRRESPTSSAPRKRGPEGPL
jgi:hypothetical protein